MVSFCDEIVHVLHRPTSSLQRHILAVVSLLDTRLIRGCGDIEATDTPGGGAISYGHFSHLLVEVLCALGKGLIDFACQLSRLTSCVALGERRSVDDIGFLQSLTQLGIFDRVNVASVVAVYLLLAQLGGADSLTRRHVHECLGSGHPAIVGIEVGDKLGLHYIDDVAILILCYVSCGLEQWDACVVNLLHRAHLLVKTREAQARLGCMRGLLGIGGEVKPKGSSGRIRLARWCELILWSQWCRHSRWRWLYPSHV